MADHDLDDRHNGSREARLPRRCLLTGIGLSSFLAATLRPSSMAAKQFALQGIPRPSTPSDAAFIRRAFEMRDLAVEKGDQAYGAVVVRDGMIISQSWSRVILDQDPSGHAEMAAIRNAARRLKSRRLSGAVLYSSSRPCPMCEGAAYWAGIVEMIHGSNASSAGPPKLCR